VTAPDEGAAALSEWYEQILRHSDSTEFAVATEERHRQVAVVDVLTRNARALLSETMKDPVARYAATCFVLAATSRLIGLVPTRDNWKSALENVRHLRNQLVHADPSGVGLKNRTAAQIFFDHFAEALVMAGVAGNETTLDEAGRWTALGLSLNWGMRFLIGLAAEAKTPKTHKAGRGARKAQEKRDLSWMHDLVAA
jgi:hypothetical protein